MLGRSGATPRSVRASFAISELVANDWLDGVKALSSFWVSQADPDLQGQLVKYFKVWDHRPSERPHIAARTSAYAAMLDPLVSECKPNAVLRVLASSEKLPETSRPHSYLSSLLADRLKVPDVTSIFFRTEPRKSMRLMDRLSGSDVLRRRINYVLQDLFIRPVHIGGTAVILDDIYNLGATARVYAAALKKFCGVEKVCSVNLAATRFNNGRDDWGKLALDVERFVTLAQSFEKGNAFRQVWVEKGAYLYHPQPDCRQIKGTAHRSLLFLSQPDCKPCAHCTSGK